MTRFVESSNFIHKKAFLSLSLIGAIFVGPGAPSAHADANAVVIGMNNEGVKALNAGNFPLAIQKFEAVLEMDKNYHLASGNLARARMQYGLKLTKTNRQEALKQFHQAYYLNKANATAAQTIDDTIRMLGKNPRDFKTRIQMAEQSRRTGDFIGAIVEYSEALKIEDDAKTHVNLGDVYRVRDNVEDAIKEYQAAARAGDSFEIEVKLGQAFQANGDIPNAVAAFSKALAFDPSDIETLDAMQASWQDALYKDPLAPDNHIGLGQTLQFRGDFGGATVEYKQAIQLSKGNNPTAQKLLEALPDLIGKAIERKAAENAYKQGKFDEAVKLYSALIQKDPKDAAYYYNRGAAEQMLKQYDQAMVDYTTARGLDPKNKTFSDAMESAKEAKAKPLIDAATAKHQAKDYAGAIDEYSAALAVLPENAPLWFNLASAQNAIENYSRAHDAYQKALEIDPEGQIEGLYLMAVIDEYYGKGPQAQAEYRRYLAKAPTGKYAQQAKVRLASLPKEVGRNIEHKATANTPEIKPLLSATSITKNSQVSTLATLATNAGFQDVNNLVAQKKYSEASQILDRVLKATPTDAKAWFNYGICKQALEDYHGALAAYEMCKTLNPSNSLSTAAAEQVRTYLKKQEEAKRLVAEEALARQKQRTELQKLIAQNEYAQATGIIDKLLKTEPKDADLWFSLGTAKQGLGDNHAALAAYEMASRLSPTDERVKTALLKIRSFLFSGETGILKP